MKTVDKKDLVFKPSCKTFKGHNSIIIKAGLLNSGQRKKYQKQSILYIPIINKDSNSTLVSCIERRILALDPT